MGLLSAGLNAPAQSTIAYFDGPSFQVSFFNGIDLNADGWGDFAFLAGSISVTYDPPGFTLSWPFSLESFGGLTTNQFLAADNVLAQPAGSIISNLPPAGATWISPGQTVPLTTEVVPNDLTNPAGVWSGTLGAMGDGYIGVRLLEADGWHYGWIHVRLPNAQESGVVVLDRAFNTRADVAILAGAKPVAVPQRTTGLVRSGWLRLQWLSDLTRSYQVQFKDNLDARLWTNLDFVVEATGTNCAVELPATGSARFYRVIEAE